MKLSLKHIALAAVLAATGLQAGAAECEIGMGIAPISEGDKVPASVARKLEAKLKMVLSHAGVASSSSQVVSTQPTQKQLPASAAAFL